MTYKRLQNGTKKWENCKITLKKNRINSTTGFNIDRQTETY